MGIIAKSTGGDFEQVPAGSYIARCYKMVDVGTQEAFWNNESKSQRQVYISWELLEDEDGEPIRMEDGRPFSISKRYTLSISSKANLRKDIDAWRGKPFTDEEAEAFDITKLLGTYCRIQVVENKKGEKTYMNVSTVSYTKKKPEGVNEPSWWSVDDPDMEALEALPEWLREKIHASQEFTVKAAVPQAKLSDEEAKALGITEDFGEEPINLDDIPF